MLHVLQASHGFVLVFCLVISQILVAVKAGRQAASATMTIYHISSIAIRSWCCNAATAGTLNGRVAPNTACASIITRSSRSMSPG